MGQWIGTDFCGVQVGREGAADEVATDGRSKKGASQSTGGVCHRDALMSLAWKFLWLYISGKEKTQMTEDKDLEKEALLESFVSALPQYRARSHTFKLPPRGGQVTTSGVH